MTKIIRGAGGGGKGAGAVASAATPTEQPDNLRSRASAHIIDLLCEGEIYGLVNGLQSVYLDGTPLQNPDASYNFTGATVVTRNGTQAQGYIPGFSSVESETVVNTEVKNTAAIVRTITNANVDAVRITVGLPSLTYQDTSGNISGTSVQIAVDVQSNGGGYVTQILNGNPYDTISGKTTSRYQRSYRIPLTGSAPWDIRVRRITADSTSATLQNKTWWDSYSEIVEAKLRYPNSALVAMTVDSSQFQSIPARGYDIKGLLVKVPSNYNPVTRVYTGTWDGTFTVAWTDNPAWCFYDLLTNDRYGLGKFVDDSQVDKWALYTIGKYCDELVPDGFGSTEPRFTCNAYIQTREDAYKVVNNLASVFRAITFWASGSITAVQDSPADAAYLYTPSNVVDGLFTYSGSSAKTRHTVALVTWNDPADLYRQKVEYVEDTDGIARYGVVQTEITAFACTSRGQAHRAGMALLLSERLESDVVVFKVGLDGAVCRPGQIIKVADPARAGVRSGGRLTAATTTTATLDAAVTLAAATTYTLAIINPSGAVEERTVTTAAGTTNALTVSPAFSVAPEAQSIWILSSASVQPQQFRVITVTEDDKNQFTVNALAYDQSKYAAIENGLKLEARSISLLSTKPDKPDNGTKTEYLYEAATDLKTMVTLGVDAVYGAVAYQFSYRVDSGNFTDIPASNTPTAQINDAQPGVYTVNVTCTNALGFKSPVYTYTTTVLGKTQPPADVTGLQMQIQSGNGLLSWDTHPDLDVRLGGRIVVRYSAATVGVTWNTSIPIADFAGSSTTGIVPLLSGTYLARALDSSGNYSTGDAVVITSAQGVLQFNAVETSVQQPTFSGAKTNMEVSGSWLVLSQTYFWDDIADLDAYTEAIDAGISASGSYEFDAPVDIGAVYTCRVSADVQCITFDVNNFVDGWPSIDDVLDIDGILDVDAATLQLQISTTSDDPGGTPTWSAYAPFTVGEYLGRGFRFRLDVARGALTSQQVAVTTLSATVDMPDRVEGDDNVSVPAVGATISFAAPFFAVPAVAVTAENMATGDYYTITGKTETGFSIQFLNSSGTGVARTMDWIAKGYGYKQ